MLVYVEVEDGLELLEREDGSGFMGEGRFLLVRFCMVLFFEIEI